MSNQEELDRINELLDQHSNAGVQEKDRYQMQKLIWTFIHFIGGIIGIFAIAAIIRYFSPSGSEPFLSSILLLAGDIAIPVAIFGLLWIAATQSFASGQFVGTQYIKAWGGDPKSGRTDYDKGDEAYNQYIKNVDFGGWIVGYFWAAVFIIVWSYNNTV